MGSRHVLDFEILISVIGWSYSSYDFGSRLFTLIDADRYLTTTMGGSDRGFIVHDLPLKKSESDLSESVAGPDVVIKIAMSRPPPPAKRSRSRSPRRHEKVQRKQNEGIRLSKAIGLRESHQASNAINLGKALGLRSNGAEQSNRRQSENDREFQAYCKFRDSQLKKNRRSRSKSPGRNFLGLRPSQKELRQSRANVSFISVVYVVPVLALHLISFSLYNDSTIIMTLWDSQIYLMRC